MSWLIIRASSLAGCWGKRAKKVGTVDCVDNLHIDVQEGLRACIRNSTTSRPEWEVDHPQLHLTLMRPYCRTRKGWIACPMTGIWHMSKHMSTQPISINKSKPAKGFAMWQKGSAARVRDEATVWFPKTKTILIGTFIRLSGSPHVEFLGTEVMRFRSVM